MDSGDYTYNQEYRDSTGMDVREAYRFMETLAVSLVHKHLVLYEAHRLVGVALENSPGSEPKISGEKWLPVSRPTPDYNMAAGVIDWDAKAHPDAIYRIVKTTIQQEVVWPKKE